jgi:hemerythrin HHE cation binding domain-containing protein
MGPTLAHPALDNARRQRVELLDVMHRLEHALAAPAGSGDWRAMVGAQLGRLRGVFAYHIEVTEGNDGLYADLLAYAPRLARGVERLTREHATIGARIEVLLNRLDVDAELLRGRATDLLTELSRHRQRGADLVYEAYATDIGGE